MDMINSLSLSKNPSTQASDLAMKIMSPLKSRLAIIPTTINLNHVRLLIQNLLIMIISSSLQREPRKVGPDTLKSTITGNSELLLMRGNPVRRGTIVVKRRIIPDLRPVKPMATMTKPRRRSLKIVRRTSSANRRSSMCLEVKMRRRKSLNNNSNTSNSSPIRSNNRSSMNLRGITEEAHLRREWVEDRLIM